MKRLLLPVLFIGSTGFAEAADIWSFTTSIGHSVTHESAKASVKYAQEDLFEIGTRDIRIRLQPRLKDGVTETTEFNRNNTLIFIYLDVDGKKVRAGCDPAEEPEGRFTWTELTEDRVGGTFLMNMVSCDNFYTAEALAFEGLPFTVEGEFSLERR